MHTKFWSKNLDDNGSITLEWILQKYGVKMWAGFVWLGTGSSGELLGTR